MQRDESGLVGHNAATAQMWWWLWPTGGSGVLSDAVTLREVEFVCGFCGFSMAHFGGLTAVQDLTPTHMHLPNYTTLNIPGKDQASQQRVEA